MINTWNIPENFFSIVHDNDTKHYFGSLVNG